MRVEEQFDQPPSFAGERKNILRRLRLHLGDQDLGDAVDPARTMFPAEADAELVGYRFQHAFPRIDDDRRRRAQPRQTEGLVHRALRLGLPGGMRAGIISGSCSEPS